jgi:MFS family permease
MLFALAMQYFNTGMRTAVILAIQDLFNSKYHVDPGKATLWLSYINLPWAPKLLYGILTDSFPIFGSTKRSYVLLMGVIQFITLMLVACYDWPTVGPVVWLTIVYSIGGAFMEVVCQGLMVVEARKDPKAGSEDLQTFAWIFYGIGGTVACLIAGWLTTKWEDGGGARITYAMAAVFTLILGLSGPCIDKKLESNQTEMVQMSFWPRTKLVFHELGEGLRIKELYTSLIYQMVIGCLVPQFTTYLYYYYIDIQDFQPFTYAML